MSSSKIMLDIQNLNLNFSGFQALRNVCLQVTQGHFHALIGPNGAGKTSLFNCLSGLYRQQSGQAILQGVPLLNRPPHAICALGLVRSFQQPRLFAGLSVLENMQRAALGHHRHYFRFWPQKPDQDTHQWLMTILQQVGLSSVQDRQARHLAHGQQKQLDLALCLAMRPKLLLLDEPTAGMSVTETREATRVLARIAKAHDITVLFSEHDMGVVFDLADRITVLQAGQVIASDRPAVIRQHAKVQQAYLGTSESHA